MVVRIPIERREELRSKINNLLKEYLGSNGYMAIVIYEALEILDTETGAIKTEVMSHMLTNLDARSTILSWQNVLKRMKLLYDAITDDYNLPLKGPGNDNVRTQTKT